MGEPQHGFDFGRVCRDRTFEITRLYRDGGVVPCDENINLTHHKSPIVGSSFIALSSAAEASDLLCATSPIASSAD